MAAQLPTGGIPETINSDLQNERNKATFNPSKITNLLDGSEKATARRKQLESLITNDPTSIFSNEDNHYLHRTDRHVRALAKLVRLVEICRSIGIGADFEASPGEITRNKDFYTFLNAVADDLPAALHWVMFVPNLMSLADEEQQKQWLPMCRDWRMIGCYAQTELGHGSNVRALETTATFVREGSSDKGGDMKGGAWIINSPTLTSIKFWPGTLGRTCNHAMVIARLIDGDGVDRGMHNFLVPTRSMKDHSLLPGVTCGDIGPKIGYNNMDNGFAKFEHVVIPRRNMAMRFAHVNEQGQYKKIAISEAQGKIAYITMMQVRAYIVNEASKTLRMGTTMAIRYSAVRKQGFKADGKSENQILDYKQQQHRLFPLLAASYCFFFTGKKLLEDLTAIEHRLYAIKDSGSSESGISKTEVGDIHASTSALKSFTSTITADGIEDCRKACGGHGFLQSSGFPEMINAYLQNPTVEGDNQMLPVQVAKILLKMVKDIQGGDETAISEWKKGDSRYLVSPIQAMLNGDELQPCQAASEEEMRRIDILLAAYQHRAARLLIEVASQIQDAVSGGISFQEAWNGALIHFARLSRAHSLFILLDNFFSGIKSEDGKNIGPREVDVLTDLATLFGCYWIEKEVGDFLEDDYMTAEQVKWVRASTLFIMDKIRPNAVALVDANDFSDFRLKSALGRYDGNVYPAILQASKKDPLNATEPGPGYEEHLKRLIVDGVGVYSGTASRL